MSQIATLTPPPSRPRTARLSADHRAGLFGLGWSGLAQVFTLGIRLASNLLLTRLLAPEVYGILGSALAVVTTLEWLSDLGIVPTLIRHPNGSSRPYLLTGWLMGLSRGVLVAALAAAVAWPLAAFYERPELFAVLLALALRPLLMAFRSPGVPLMRRELHYRAVFVDEVTQQVVGTAVALAAAWWLRSVWAVVAGTLAGAAAAVVVSYLLVPVRPSLAWDRDAARGIAGLGRQVFVNTLVMALWLNFAQLLGLRFVDPAHLGLYVVAWNLAAVLEGLLTRACDVHFSMLSRLTDPERQADWHLAVCRRAALFGMPVLAGLVLVGPLCVRVLYDARYAAAGVLFSLMLARLMLRCLGQIQFQYLLARAEVRLATRAYLVALVVQAACLFPLIRAFGVTGLALSVLVSTAAMTIVQTALAQRLTGREWGPLVVTAGWTVVAVALLAATTAAF